MRSLNGEEEVRNASARGEEGAYDLASPLEAVRALSEVRDDLVGATLDFTLRSPFHSFSLHLELFIQHS